MRWAVSLRWVLGLVMAAGLLGTGCGTVRHSPARSPGTTKAGPQVLLSQQGLEIIDARWIHAGDLATRLMEAENRMREMGAPEHVIVGTRGMSRDNLRLDYMVDDELKARRASYLLMKARMDPETQVRFASRGALILTLVSPQGIREDVPDLGLLLCPGRYHDDYLDTARAPVTFHHGFDGKPDYRQWWHLIYVRLPDSHEDWKVESVKPDSTKVTFLSR